MSLHILNIFLFCLLFSFGCKNDNRKANINCTDQKITTKAKQPLNIAEYRLISRKAKNYCRSRKLESDFYLLIDLSRHSGLKRFFIWDFKKDTIINSFLVSHGCNKNPWGKDYTKEKAIVSNTDGSHCSSVGKYIIGNRSYSEWGIKIKYTLTGLDVTNSNAEKREIVLHSWNRVPEQEVFPNGCPEGWGCHAISNTSMKLIDTKLRSSKKNVLLWIII